MKCKSCATNISTEYAYSIQSNICPRCGQDILPPEQHAQYSFLLNDLKRVLQITPDARTNDEIVFRVLTVLVENYKLKRKSGGLPPPPSQIQSPLYPIQSFLPQPQTFLPPPQPPIPAPQYAPQFPPQQQPPNYVPGYPPQPYNYPPNTVIQTPYTQDQYHGGPPTLDQLPEEEFTNPLGPIDTYDKALLNARREHERYAQENNAFIPQTNIRRPYIPNNPLNDGGYHSSSPPPQYQNYPGQTHHRPPVNPNNVYNSAGPSPISREGGEPVGRSSDAVYADMAYRTSKFRF